MKRILFAILLGLSGVAHADGDFNCVYAKANISNGKLGTMNVLGKAKVSIIGDSMKAYRPDGGFIYSPPVRDDKGAIWMTSDGSKFYAVSKDFTNFSVSDKITQKTEQWSECSLIKQSGNKPSNSTKPSHWDRRNLTNAERKYVENAIRNRLKDPDSAKFKHSMYVSNGEGAYCGLVNSKNSYGGYVGDSPFMALITHKNGKATGAGVISIGGDSAEEQATIMTCQDNGYFN